ncbi:MAG: DUF2085 domain-containing protein [Bacteroidota bacterium]|nr:DUF2085 domain-containing protein [Bacteroidota bacterium]
MVSPLQSIFPAGGSRFYYLGALLSIGLGLLMVMALLPPFVSEPIRDALMHAFAPVCHQLPARSPHIDGVSFAVCHRCFGAYTGLFAGSIVYLFVRTWPKGIRPALALLVAAVPGVIDWSGEVLGIWTNTPVSRMMTGAFFGVLAGLLLASAVLDTFQRNDTSA